ncbi:hypothetical protein [Microbacterium sp. MEJ108Y]|uniref:hypothetical protein n=1 Tax=Microbacterium sp. MEJ108Y TaxID=1587523 RepID=UPI001E2DC028|nr:hypothetical protein [Microbacterium sp. MEJ108Y]
MTVEKHFHIEDVVRPVLIDGPSAHVSGVGDFEAAAVRVFEGCGAHLSLEHDRPVCGIAERHHDRF